MFYTLCSLENIVMPFTKILNTNSHSSDLRQLQFVENKHHNKQVQTFNLEFIILIKSVM